MVLLRMRAPLIMLLLLLYGSLSVCSASLSLAPSLPAAASSPSSSLLVPTSSVHDAAAALPQDCQAGGIFIPTAEFRPVCAGQALPPGLHVRLNLATGLREARLLAPEDAAGAGASVDVSADGGLVATSGSSSSSSNNNSSSINGSGDGRDGVVEGIPSTGQLVVFMNATSAEVGAGGQQDAREHAGKDVAAVDAGADARKGEAALGGGARGSNARKTDRANRQGQSLLERSGRTPPAYSNVGRILPPHAYSRDDGSSSSSDSHTTDRETFEASVATVLAYDTLAAGADEVSLSDGKDGEWMADSKTGRGSKATGRGSGEEVDVEEEAEGGEDAGAHTAAAKRMLLLRQALEDLADLSHELYYGVEVAKNAPLVRALLRLVAGNDARSFSHLSHSSSSSSSASSGPAPSSSPSDAAVAAIRALPPLILGNALQNSPAALDAIGRIRGNGDDVVHPGSLTSSSSGSSSSSSRSSDSPQNDLLLSAPLVLNLLEQHAAAPKVQERLVFLLGQIVRHADSLDDFVRVHGLQRLLAVFLAAAADDDDDGDAAIRTAHNEHAAGQAHRSPAASGPPPLSRDGVRRRCARFLADNFLDPNMVLLPAVAVAEGGRGDMESEVYTRGHGREEEHGQQVTQDALHMWCDALNDARQRGAQRSETRAGQATGSSDNSDAEEGKGEETPKEEEAADKEDDEEWLRTRETLDAALAFPECQHWQQQQQQQQKRQQQHRHQEKHRPAQAVLA